jgi:Recombination endonuclease VII
MDAKRCTKCGEVKPLSEFYAADGMRDGHRNDCIVCNKAARRERTARNPEPHRERARRWAAENPERRAAYAAEYRNRPDRKRAMRDLYYRRTYGITADQADEILASQNGCCAICCKPAPERLASMHLDHDHETGQIRGFLCLDCNHGLGKLRDSPDLLLRALVYLRQQTSPPVPNLDGTSGR